jgi:hypothetical protein
VKRRLGYVQVRCWALAEELAGLCLLFGLVDLLLANRTSPK